MTAETNKETRICNLFYDTFERFQSFQAIREKNGKIFVSHFPIRTLDCFSSGTKEKPCLELEVCDANSHSFDVDQARLFGRSLPTALGKDVGLKVEYVDSPPRRAKWFGFQPGDSRDLKCIFIDQPHRWAQIGICFEKN